MAPFEWANYLAAAKFFAGCDPAFLDKETALRCSVSRAYYAAYGRAYAYACQVLKWVPSASDKSSHHGELRSRYRARRHDIASRLGRLRDWRNDCDYEIVSTADVERSLMAAQAIKDAEYVLRQLVLPAPSPPTAPPPDPSAGSTPTPPPPGD